MTDNTMTSSAYIAWRIHLIILGSVILIVELLSSSVLAQIDEDCLPYDPENLSIVDEGASGWLLTDGRSRMEVLDNRADAEAALALARRHTDQCFIGRGNNREDRLLYIVEYWEGAPNGCTMNGTFISPCISTEGNDRIIGTSGDDIIVAGGGDDFIDGGGGNDFIDGGDGNDTINGGDGNDIINGGTGIDKINGGPGNDILLGQSGNDLLEGDEGDDCVIGGPGNDRLFSGKAADVVILQNALIRSGLTLQDDCTIVPTVGKDTLDGTDGDDVICGDDGNDTMTGGPGNDILRGYDGTDTLHGDSDNDILDGGEGADTCIGGLGLDDAAEPVDCEELIP
jgi:hypothetical protein